MKTLFLILIFGSFCKVDWIDETENLIETIQIESEYVKSKTKNTKEENYTVETRKYQNYNYVQVVGKDKWKDTFSFSFYSAKQFLFSSHYFLQAKFIIVKGVQDPDGSIGTISQHCVYFKNKNEGVQLKKSIEYSTKSNRDSLVKILQNMPFDTLKIGNIEYLRCERMYKLYK